MKTKILYFFCVLCSIHLTSQTFVRELQNTGCRLFAGSVYVYGMKGNDKNTSFNLYKAGLDLKVTDSVIINLGKRPVAEFLQLNSDTLHDFLNIYIQEKEKKLVRVIRFNSGFKQVAYIENVDVARLNSISTFQDDVYYYKRDAFCVKVSNSDSAGKQFFLEKYSCKSDQKNFEYEMKWQFPFERKNIHSAHIIYVNDRYVLLYVSVSGGLKSGQWILKINQQKGTLIKGTKIGNKGNADFYSFGTMFNDTVAGLTYIVGQKFNAADFSQENNKINITGKPFATVYLAQIDSSLELVSRDEFKVPIAEPKSNKAPNAYVLRQYGLTKTQDGSFVFKTDVYKGGNLGCYHYCNSLSNTITVADEKLVFDKSVVSTNTVIERYYFTPDKADMNGKLCCDSISDFEKMYYKNIPLEVKVDFKSGNLPGTAWILKKSDAKKSIDNFSILDPGKKIFEPLKVEEINKSEDPQVLPVSSGQFIISRQLLNDKFQVKLFTW